MAMYAIQFGHHPPSTLTYETNVIPTPCRFVSVQVDFVSDDARQSHRYCSLPVYFDRFSILLSAHPFSSGQSHKFNKVISLSTLLNSSLLSNDNLSFTVQILPVSLASLSLQTQFLLAARCKCVQSVSFI